jgi:hypothetical protein
VEQASGLSNLASRQIPLRGVNFLKVEQWDVGRFRHFLEFDVARRISARRRNQQAGRLFHLI